MGLQQFSDKVQKGVREFLGEGTEVCVKQVRKNNGVMLEGMTIMKEGDNLSPTIYLDVFFEEYEKGKTLGEVVREIVSIYENSNAGNKIDMSFFGDYKKVRRRIFCKLVNFEKNRELLKEVPHLRFLDLAVVCYYSYMNELIGNGTITIYQSHMQRWDISEEQLFQEAMENTRKVLHYEWRNMQDMVKDMLEEGLREQIQEYAGGEVNLSEEWMEEILRQMLAEAKEQHGDQPMYVLTNCSRFLGAVCMVYDDILEHMGRIIGNDFYILPSSIHELILLPGAETEAKDNLKNLVNEVNTTQVEPEEILSDSVYYYDTKLKKLFLL